MDLLDFAEVIMELQEHFDLDPFIDPPMETNTVGDIVNFIQRSV